jgi:hypothetical protein
VCFDLVYGGNKQAIQSGVYYYGFDGSSTAIPDEIPQTTAAYNYIKELVPKIIEGKEISTATLYQSVEQQVLGTPGTPAESTDALNALDLIISIINNGPSVALEPEPISLQRAISAYPAYAAELLLANRDFIKAEVIAYVLFYFKGLVLMVSDDFIF